MLARVMPGGRPSKYRKEFCKIAQKLAEFGATDDDICLALGISRFTLQRWQAHHSEFSAALKLGKEPADERVERSLFHRANGYSFDAVKILKTKDDEPLIVPYREHVPPDTTACIFWLKNRRPDLWRDKRDIEHTGKDGAPLFAFFSALEAEDELEAKGETLQ